jgi:hypothetical protein
MVRRNVHDPVQHKKISIFEFNLPHTNTNDQTTTTTAAAAAAAAYTTTYLPP